LHVFVFKPRKYQHLRFSSAIPTADYGFNRYPMPDKVQKLLIDQLNLDPPPQFPPRITSAKTLEPLI